MWTVIVRDPTGKLHSKTPLKVGVIRIGRGNDCDIVLKSGAVSRLHGRLLVTDSQTLVFSDEKSANGSIVNGQTLQGAALDVNESSTIMLGGFHISLEREGSAAAGDEMAKTLQYSAEQIRNMMQAAPPKPAARPAPPTPVPAAQPAPAAAPPMPTLTVEPPQPPPPRPTAPAPAFKSPLEGMQFVIPETPKATAQIGQVQHDKLSDSMAHLLDQQIRGIQSQRTEVEKTMRSAKEQFEQAWKDAIIAARELQARIGKNPKVMYFVVSRDEQEVSVKVADNSKRGQANLLLTRKHPETGKGQDGFVWLGVFGEVPRSFRDPKEALEEFVRRIASKLA